LNTAQRRGAGEGFSVQYEEGVLRAPSSVQERCGRDMLESSIDTHKHTLLALT